VHLPSDTRRVEAFDSFGSFEEATSDRVGSAPSPTPPARLRESQHACTQVVQSVARHDAAAVDCDRNSPKSRPLSHSGAESFRHVDCNFPSASASFSGLHRKQPNHSHSSPGEEKRGRSPRSVPSMPSPIPDFRERARFEWSVRQPSRREMQCVPN